MNGGLSLALAVSTCAHLCGLVWLMLPSLINKSWMVSSGPAQKIGGLVQYFFSYIDRCF